MRRERPTVATLAEPIPAAPRRRATAAAAGLQTGRLVTAHIWVAIAAFAFACLLGVWQMWARSPLPAPFLTAETYFTSVTAHGVAMAYVLPTFVVMGFGYYVAETAQAHALPGSSRTW